MLLCLRCIRLNLHSYSSRELQKRWVRCHCAEAWSCWCGMFFKQVLICAVWHLGRKSERLCLKWTEWHGTRLLFSLWVNEPSDTLFFFFFFWAHFYVRALKWRAVLKAESRCDHGYVENTGISDQFTYWQAPQLLPIMNFLATLFFHSDLNPKNICDCYVHILRQLVGAFYILPLRLWNCVMFLIDWIGSFFFLFV